MMKDCRSCLWYDKCDHVDICDDYADENTEEEARESEYLNDLKARATLYDAQIEEQNN